MRVPLLVRRGSVAHSRPDPVASGLSGWYSTSCFRWENTRGIFGCLLISFESRAGRQENTHFQVLCEVISLHAHTHTHALVARTPTHRNAHARTPSSLHSPQLISSWLSASCYSAGDDTHARARTYTHALVRDAHELSPLTQESFMLPSKSLFS